MPPQDFLIFCVCNALSLNYIGYESDGNDMKTSGGVTIFVNLCKMLVILIMKFVRNVEHE